MTWTTPFVRRMRTAQSFVVAPAKAGRRRFVPCCGNKAYPRVRAAMCRAGHMLDLVVPAKAGTQCLCVEPWRG